MLKNLYPGNPYPAPKLVIKREVKNFYDFKVEDFELVDYKRGKQIKNIEIAI